MTNGDFPFTKMGKDKTMYRFIDRLSRKFMISAVVAGCGLFAVASPASAGNITASDVDQALYTIFCSNSFEAGECQVAMLFQKPTHIAVPQESAPTPATVPLPEPEEEPEPATGVFGEPGGGC